MADASPTVQEQYAAALAKLRGKQRTFVLEYLVDLHGQNAAIRAGYSADTARSQASRLLTNVNIREARDLGMQCAAMPPAEVVARISAHARGDMADFLRIERVRYHPRQPVPRPTPEDPKAVDWVEDPEPVERLVVALDLEQARDRGLLHLIKKLKWDKFGEPEIELYDAHAPQALLAKIHGLVVDRKELSGPNGGPIEIDDARDTLADKLTRRLAAGDADPGAGGDPGA